MTFVWSFWTVLLLVSSVGIVVYELVAAAKAGTDPPTITGIVQCLSRRPAVPFLCGLLAGHLFFSLLLIVRV